tara:strand:- start:49 stop:342 length:294 start_codon:yes stop_codon:yes gene_type:complete
MPKYYSSNIKRTEMKITKHAKLRMHQRGINPRIADYAEYFLPSLYKNQSNKILLSKKMAREEARRIRKFADILEKHAGTELLIDPSGSDLITAYRRP